MCILFFFSKISFFTCTRNAGELCVEGGNHNEDKDTFEDYVNVVNTRNRIARVDGRNIHWVRSWTGGDRYSLIFYDTTSRFQTPIIETGVCLDFLSVDSE